MCAVCYRAEFCDDLGILIGDIKKSIMIFFDGINFINLSNR